MFPDILLFHLVKFFLTDSLHGTESHFYRGHAAKDGYHEFGDPSMSVYRLDAALIMLERTGRDADLLANEKSFGISHDVMFVHHIGQKLLFFLCDRRYHISILQNSGVLMYFRKTFHNGFDPVSVHKQVTWE